MFAGIPNARAAFVTIDETGLDAVFSQGSFGATPVDIRFNPIVILPNSAFLNINDSAGLNALFALNNVPASNVVSMYFVDFINFCSAEIPAIVGCASFPGNDIVVESAVAAGASGTELLAHELGHNLNLDHVMFPNLMTAFINGDTTLVDTLTDPQVTTILASGLIQMDALGRFIEITPVLVTPLPPAGILFVTAIFVLLGVHRRKKLGV